MKCPHCQGVIDVHLVKAPPMQAQTAAPAVVTGDLGELLDSIDVSRLNGQALDFVVETRQRFNKYKATTRVSDKQMAWLQKIAAGEFYYDKEESW